MVETENQFAVTSWRQRCAKRYSATVRHDISEIIRESIDYGLAHRGEAVTIRFPMPVTWAQLTDKFIGMYVNDFTRDYGETGRAAIREFLSDGFEKGYIGRSDRTWSSSNDLASYALTPLRFKIFLPHDSRATYQ